MSTRSVISSCDQTALSADWDFVADFLIVLCLLWILTISRTHRHFPLDALRWVSSLRTLLGNFLTSSDKSEVKSFWVMSSWKMLSKSFSKIGTKPCFERASKSFNKRHVDQQTKDKWIIPLRWNECSLVYAYVDWFKKTECSLVYIRCWI